MTTEAHMHDSVVIEVGTHQSEIIFDKKCCRTEETNEIRSSLLFE